jgi:hypothetical protein
MAETNIISALINQAPGMATLVIVVVLFLRFMEKRDALFIAQMKDVAGELSLMKTLLSSHDGWEREVIDNIQKGMSANRKPRAK